MKKILFNRAGVRGNRTVPLYEYIIKKYGGKNIFMTTETDDIIKRYKKRVCDVVDTRKFTEFKIQLANAKKYHAADAVIIGQMTLLQPYIIMTIGRAVWNDSYLHSMNVYYDYLSFWNGYIEKNNIEVYFSECVPHEFNDLIIYSLCKCKGIPVFVINNAFEKYGYISNDYLYPVKKEYFGTSIDAHAREKLNEDFSDILNNFMDTDKDVTPAFNSKEFLARERKRIDKKYKLLFPKRLAYSMLYMVQVLFRTHHTDLIRFLYRQSAQDYLNLCGEAVQYYNKNAIPGDMNIKFVYFPLHYQPELTTVPRAGIFENQILVLRIISECLPKDVKIYVKEHPYQFVDYTTFPRSRDIRYYQEIKSISRVELIKIETNTYDLIRHCIFVATVSGTAGFEALFRDKQVIHFGGCFYNFAPGAYRVSTAAECRHAIDKIMSNYRKYKTNEKLMADWLLKLQNKCFYLGLTDDEYPRIGKNKVQGCSKDILESITSAIDSVVSESSSVR